MADKWSIYFGIAAGVIYNSWLLAYWLNPHIVHIGLSSDLEASGQPYNWVFIAADVLSATLLLSVVWMFRNKKGLLWLLAVRGYGVFAIMTAASAVLPLHCSADISSCGFQAGQQFGLHDLTSGLAALGLFISLFAAWLHNLHSSRLLQYLSGFGLLAWSSLGLVFLVATLKSQHIVGVQQEYLILTGVVLWLMPYTLLESDRGTITARKV